MSLLFVSDCERSASSPFQCSASSEKSSHICFQNAILVVQNRVAKNTSRSALVLSGLPVFVPARRPLSTTGDQNLKLASYLKHGLFGAVALIIAGARLVPENGSHRVVFATQSAMASPVASV